MRALPSSRLPDPVLHPRAPKEAYAAMAAEVREGLSRRPLRELPCKYFYDERGSDLFERITALPEYYPTRTETAICGCGGLWLRGLKSWGARVR